MRRRDLLKAAGVTAATTAVVPSIAGGSEQRDCDESLLDCEYDQTTTVLPMEGRQVTALVEPRTDGKARRLYESLVPEGYEVPADPTVGLWMVQADIPRDQEGSFQWMEGAISIRVRCPRKAETGWYHLSMPTNSTDAYDLGRGTGFPKYVAEMSLSTDGDARTATATVSGETTATLAWTPASGEAGEDLQAWTTQDDSQFAVSPVHEGPSMYRVKYTPKPYVPDDDANTVFYGNEDPFDAYDSPVGNPEFEGVTELPDPEYGQVSYDVDPHLDAVHEASAATYDHSTDIADLFGPGESLADLIPASGTVPGQFWHAQYTLVLQSDEMGPPSDAGFAAPDHPGGDWTTFGEDLYDHRHQTEETRIGPSNVASLELAWQHEIPSYGEPPMFRSDLQKEGAMAGTPLVVDGGVYAATRSGVVFGLNAETGELVWQRALEDRVPTLAYDVSGGTPRIFCNVAAFEDGDTEKPDPHITALHARTGEVLWRTEPLDHLPGSELTGSPVTFSIGGRDLVLTGISGWPGEEQDREDWYSSAVHRGSYAIVDQKRGEILEHTYVIPDEDFCRGEPSPDCTNEAGGDYDGYSGGGVWTTPAVDLETGHAYFGTGNPSSDNQHEHTNALLKVDVDPRRRSFGDIVDSYRGDPDGDVLYDLDFGASPNLIDSEVAEDKLVGALQKSGRFHVVDTATMEPVWTEQVGAVGTTSGMAATAATDGTSLFQPTGQGPEGVYSLDVESGSTNWFQPTPGQGWYGPATVANGVVYIADQSFLRAFDAETGAPLLDRPMAADNGGHTHSPDAGVAVARNTLYISAGEFLAAYRLPDALAADSGGDDL